MRVVILCAGLGTRLYPFTDLIPKALLPVGSKPCVRWIVERLERQGFRDFLIRANKRFAGMFKHEFRDKPNVSFSFDTKPRGTAGEILKVQDQLTSPFVLYFGDELTNYRVDRLVAFHKLDKPLVSLALVRGIPLEVGVVETEKQKKYGLKVTKFVEKPPLKELLTWAGIAVMEKRIVEYIELGEDFGSNVFPRLIEKGEKVYGYDFDAYWLDVGQIHHLRRANQLARAGKL